MHLLGEAWDVVDASDGESAFLAAGVVAAGVVAAAAAVVAVEYTDFLFAVEDSILECSDGCE